MGCLNAKPPLASAASWRAATKFVGWHFARMRCQNRHDDEDRHAIFNSGTSYLPVL